MPRAARCPRTGPLERRAFDYGDLEAAMQAMDAAIRKARAGLARVAGTGRRLRRRCGMFFLAWWVRRECCPDRVTRPRTGAVLLRARRGGSTVPHPSHPRLPGGPACGQVRAPTRPQRREFLDEPFGIEPGVPGDPKSDVEAFQQRLDADGPALADGEQIWKSPLLWALGPAYRCRAPNVTRVPTTERMTRPASRHGRCRVTAPPRNGAGPVPSAVYRLQLGDGPRT